MITQQKSSAQIDLRSLLDILMVTIGTVGGGIAALVGLWLWFDYQAGPADSILAQLSAALAALLPGTLRSGLEAQTRLMGLPLTGQTSAYWYMARAGGMVAYLLMWFSVVWGLLLSTKVAMKRIPPTLSYGIHEYTAILTVVFAALHAVVLLGDEYIEFNIFHLAIPFTAPYEPVWTGLGVIALYLTIAITASFYLRKQIGQKAWRALHYFTFVAYLLALVHGITAGSDSGLLISALFYWGTGFSVLFLTQLTIIQHIRKGLKSHRKATV
ncbi:MAG: hypothetical protein Kow0031_00210 [Anaerolineae bacterium]